MSQLPKGWVETTLDKIATWGSGGTPKRNEPSYYGGDIPWVKTGDLGPKLLKEASEYISRLGLDNSSAKLFPKGSVAIAMYGATIGKTSILDFETSTNQACAVGSPIDGLTSTEFLYYFLASEKQNFIKKGKGGAQPNISQQLIKAHNVMLPPLAEQTRIVEKLDEVLAQVDTIKARLDGIPAILKCFRQSVLAAAVSGKLTDEWRGGSCFVAKEYTLQDLTHMDIGHAFKSKEFSETGIPLLRGQNIEPGALRWVDTKFFPEDKLTSHRKLFIEEGDIILAMDRPIVSAGLKLARAKKSDLPCVLVQRVARIRTNDLAIDDYIYLLLKDASFSDYLVPNQTGSDIPHISGKQIQAYQIAIPALEEQKEIVRLVDQYFAFADTIEAQVKKAQARVDKLTQSILAKAFRGELVPQDPNDEPADKLLERIALARKEAEVLAKAAKKTAKK
ncbi:restriction endonuclease subunit S [Vibrio cholerae]|nr:type I restriction endonuclease subunit S [Vibrio cholerae]EKF9480273.1 restriction endonuclease subunit S [Vibrio cholerae]